MTKTRLLAGLLVVAAGASAITAGVLAGAGGAGKTQRGSDAVSRVERAFNQAWTSECDFDACVITTFPAFPITTPTDVANVDVTMTVTLEYATTAGTAARAGAEARLAGGSASSIGMAPTGGFRLAPSLRPTTTTLTWVKRRLAAAGRTYNVRFGISIRSLTGDDTYSIRGRRLAVVIETWSAGS